MTQTEDDDAPPTTSSADDEPLRAAFAGVVAAVIEAHPTASPARESAIRQIVDCHARLVRILAAPPDVTSVWISTQLH
jgi:hypothetical protein